MITSRIDSAILSALGRHWTKVALVISRAESALSRDLPARDERYEVIASRVEALVREGHLAAQGDIKNWRFSEVCVKSD